MRWIMCDDLLGRLGYDDHSYGVYHILLRIVLTPIGTSKDFNTVQKFPGYRMVCLTILLRC
jgi:hypothetical protein